MGQTGGFLVIQRKQAKDREPKIRIKDSNEFHQPLSESERRKQAARCMDCGVPFCQYGQEIEGMASGCPLNNVIPEWNDYIYQGQYEEALKRLLMKDPFPEFTSRVCPSPCEKACTCALHGEAVTICENEKAIIEYGFEHNLIQLEKPNLCANKKIAIVGSGPSGLAAAQSLIVRGYEVHVFEKSDRLGGLLMYGIPNMKLEKNIVERRIKVMQDAGVQFHTNHGIDSKQDAQKLLNDYDRILLAVGAQKARDIQVEGRDCEDVLFAIDYLTQATKAILEDTTSTLNAFNKHVLVVGGGDTGNDCVGTSIRQGCLSVTQLEIMPKAPNKRLESNPWPEWPKISKTDYGQEEAIAVFGQDPRRYETTMKSLVKDAHNRLKEVELVSVEWIQDPQTKQRNMKEVEGSTQTIPCDMVLIAAGFVGVKENILEAFDCKATSHQTIECENYQTINKQVFACGDARRGQSLVVWAIREGMEVAKAIDIDLMGYSNL